MNELFVALWHVFLTLRQRGGLVEQLENVHRTPSFEAIEVIFHADLRSNERFG